MKKIYSPTLVIIAASFAISACGGGGSGGTADSRAVKRNLSYNQLIAEGTAIEKRNGLDTQTPPLTPIANMPVSGKATYIGVAGFQAGKDTILVDERRDSNGRVVYQSYAVPLAAQARMTADFGKKTLSGELTDFRAHEKATTTGGRITYNGTITGNETRGRFTGQVNQDGVNHRVDMPGIGGFSGKNAKSLAISGSTGPYTGSDDFQEIGLAAEKK